MESLSCVCVCALTVEEAVVFEAASAEQRVERVQALLALHGASVRSVDVRGAFWGQRAGQLLLRQLLVPETHTHRKLKLLIVMNSKKEPLHPVKRVFALFRVKVFKSV